MAKLSVTVRDTDVFKRLLQLLKDISADERIDENIRAEYIQALDDIAEQSQAERK